MKRSRFNYLQVLHSTIFVQNWLFELTRVIFFLLRICFPQDSRLRGLSLEMHIHAFVHSVPSKHLCFREINRFACMPNEIFTREVNFICSLKIFEKIYFNKKIPCRSFHRDFLALSAFSDHKMQILDPSFADISPCLLWYANFWRRRFVADRHSFGCAFSLHLPHIYRRPCALHQARQLFPIQFHFEA